VPGRRGAGGHFHAGALGGACVRCTRPAIFHRNIARALGQPLAGVNSTFTGKRGCENVNERRVNDSGERIHQVHGLRGGRQGTQRQTSPLLYKPPPFELASGTAQPPLQTKNSRAARAADQAHPIGAPSHPAEGSPRKKHFILSRLRAKKNKKKTVPQAGPPAPGQNIGKQIEFPIPSFAQIWPRQIDIVTPCPRAENSKIRNSSSALLIRSRLLLPNPRCPAKYHNVGKSCMRATHVHLTSTR